MSDECKDCAELRTLACYWHRSWLDKNREVNRLEFEVERLRAAEMYALASQNKWTAFRLHCVVGDRLPLSERCNTDEYRLFEEAQDQERERFQQWQALRKRA